jgi:uncharacterized protein YegJ (DUF2314 family)
MYRCLGLFTFLLVVLSSCEEEKQDKAAEQTIANVYTIDDSDTAMNNAIANARAGFAKFDEAWESGEYDPRSFYLKVGFPTSSGGEHVWLTNVFSDNGVYSGIVDNNPEQNIGIKEGDTIKVDRNKLSDWMFADGEGFLQGAYTTRLIRSRMSDEDRAIFDRQFPYKIKD